MTRFILRRCVYALASLCILSVTIFVLIRLTGDPATLLAAPHASEADLATNKSSGFYEGSSVAVDQFVAHVMGLQGK